MEDSGLAAGRGRILVIDDDPVFGRWAIQLLRAEGRVEARYVTDAAAGLRQLEDGPWDLVLTDLEMPGMGGLELLERIGELEPDLPVAIITGHATVDRAVTAFRKSAAEFIQKPISATDFMIAIRALMQRGRETRTAQREIVLAVGAHPDDVEIGAGGTLLAHKSAGDSVAILTLTSGAWAGSQVRRRRAAEQAAQVIGARLFLGDLDGGTVAEGDPTIAVIDEVIARVRPTVLYTHSMHDVHQDHRNTHRAAVMAARAVGRVYCFQSASATVDFRPTHFSVIDSHVSRKLAAIDSFAAQPEQPEQPDYLQPDLIVSTARYWSRFCGGSLAEPFEAVRDRAPVRAPAGSGAVIQPVPRGGSTAGHDAPQPGGDTPRPGQDAGQPGQDPARIAHLPGARLTHHTVTCPAGRRCDSLAHSDIPRLFPAWLRQQCLHCSADPLPGAPGT
jgi:LmbE family N-acetylglucosaminyl deacetylase